MRHLHSFLVIFTLLFLSATCKPAADPDPDNLEDTYGPMNDGPEDDMQNDNVRNKDYDYLDSVDPTGVENEEDTYEKEKPAKILTQPQHFSVKRDETLVLPCKVQDLGSYVLMWANDTVILFQSNFPVTQDDNLQQLIDGSLKIKNSSLIPVRSSFKCSVMISSTNIPSVIHVVSVEHAPEIISLEAKDNNTVLKHGDTLELTCKTIGEPKPLISWHFQREHANQAERLEVEGYTLTIPNITHRQAGQYRCLADNKIGKPAHSYINVVVQHKPRVTIEQVMVNTQTGLNEELKCTVHAIPKSRVIWQRQGKNLQATDHIRFDNNGDTSILIMQNVTEDDFGSYSCVASNYLGSTTKEIKLIKTPAILKFIKPSENAREAVLSWKVQSKSPILQHELHYKRFDDTQWNIVNPKVIANEKGVYTVEYTLHNLHPDKYEAKVRSQNEHGWSEFSDVMKFEGHKTHTPAPQKDSASEVGASSLGGSSTQGGFAMLISIALLTVYYVRP